MIYIYIYLIMRFIAHVFSIGRVGLYCSYKPQSRLIFLNLQRLELCVAETQWRFLAGQCKV